MDDIAISVKNVTKLYKLYDKPSDRFKESLGLTKKKKYKEHYALRDLSFDIKRGECVGIIGTNGAGKSTILKIITGVLNPTSGDVDVNGRISALLELGAGFNMEYTGVENVYLNGTMIGFSREEIDAKLDDILAFADIGEFVHQPVKTYSSGMFVRLAFAVAINIEPEILVVDEALSVGDVFFQAKCFKKFEEFKEMGKTILFVSHDLGSISKYCDRAVLLDKGTVVEDGFPKDVIDLYKKIISSGNVAEIENVDKKIDDKSESIPTSDEIWKEKLHVNPAPDVYGNQQAEIIDYAIIDSYGNITNTIDEGTEYTIKIKIRFYSDIAQPIVAFTVRDMKGNEIAGTNTLYEECNIENAKRGDVVIVSFSQKARLRGNDYLLALGCTTFKEGEFTILHRIYDACSLTVVSTKNMVGYFDQESKIDIGYVCKE